MLKGTSIQKTIQPGDLRLSAFGLRSKNQRSELPTN